MSRPTASLLTAVALLAFDARSQTAVVREWAGATFENAVLGEFVGNFSPVAIVVRGGSLHHAFDPGRQPATGAVTCIRDGLVAPITGVTGLIGYRPSGLQDSDGDVLLIATASGVFRGRFETVAGESALVYAPCTGLGSSWNGARALTARNRPNSTIVDIAARSATADWAIFATESAGVVASNTALDRHSVNPITAVHFIDWDGNGSYEPVVVTTVGTGVGVNASVSPPEVVLECMGGLSTARSAPVLFRPSGSSVSSEQLGLVSSTFAWPQYSAAWGNWQCYPLLRQDFPANSLPAAGQIPTGLATLDMDDDGTTDMLISRVGEFRHWFAWKGLSPVSINVLPSAVGSPLANQCRFFWRDLDADGRPDLLAFWNSGVVNASGSPTKAMLFKRTMLPTLPGNTQPYPPEPPDYNSPRLSPEKPLLVGADYFEDGASAVRRVELKIKGSLQPAEHYLQVTVWLQSNPYASATSPDAALVSPAPTLLSSALLTTELVPFLGSADSEADPETIIVPLRISSTPSLSPDWEGRMHVYLDIRVIDKPHRQVVYTEVAGMVVHPSNAWNTWNIDHPLGDQLHNNTGAFQSAMSRYLTQIRIDPAIDFIELYPGSGSGSGGSRGGIPIGVILPQVELPPRPPKLPSVK